MTVANCDAAHQLGPAFRSNNAGDGPEKTRDRKSWFPRFKSNWLGTFRSKQMFPCCECALGGSAGIDTTGNGAARYKGAEGKHCVCGRDQWHLAKSVEETEYNRRMEISKALGGMRYEEAVARLRALGISEFDADRVREAGGFAPMAEAVNPIDDDTRYGRTAAKRGRSAVRSNGDAVEPSHQPYSTPPTNITVGYSSHPAPAYPVKYGSPYVVGSTSGYSPLSADYGATNSGGQPAYDHYVAAAFTDEEGFGELLQGILEDEPQRPSPATTSVGLAAFGAPLYPSQTPTAMKPEIKDEASRQRFEFPQPAKPYGVAGYHDVDAQYSYAAPDGGRPGMMSAPPISTAAGRYLPELQPFGRPQYPPAVAMPAATSSYSSVV